MTITHDNTLTSKQKDMDKFDLIPQTIVKASVIKELKRLQLEINSYKKLLKIIDVDLAFNCATDEDKVRHKELKSTIQSNTALIAEIILNEL